MTGISDRFVAGSGFISRPGVAHASQEQQFTWYGRPGAFVGELHLRPDGRSHLAVSASSSTTATRSRRSGISPPAPRFVADGRSARACTGRPSASIRRCSRTTTTYNAEWPHRHAQVQRRATHSQSRLRLQLQHADLEHLLGECAPIFGQDENFFEWAQADICTRAGPWPGVRPKAPRRRHLSVQGFVRRSDHSTVQIGRIPRLKTDISSLAPIFVRIVGEYDSSKQAALRDETRTFAPILLRQPDGTFHAGGGPEQSLTCRLAILLSAESCTVLSPATEHAHRARCFALSLARPRERQLLREAHVPVPAVSCDYRLLNTRSTDTSVSPHPPHRRRASDARLCLQRQHSVRPL